MLWKKTNSFDEWWLTLGSSINSWTHASLGAPNPTGQPEQFIILIFLWKCVTGATPLSLIVPCSFQMFFLLVSVIKERAIIYIIHLQIVLLVNFSWQRNVRSIQDNQAFEIQKAVEIILIFENHQFYTECTWHIKISVPVGNLEKEISLKKSLSRNLSRNFPNELYEAEGKLSALLPHCIPS